MTKREPSPAQLAHYAKLRELNKARRGGGDEPAAPAAAPPPIKRAPGRPKGTPNSPEKRAQAIANLVIGKGKPKGAKARPKDSITVGLVKAYHQRGGAAWLAGLDDATFKGMIVKLVERNENIEDEKRRHEDWLNYLDDVWDDLAAERAKR